MACRETSTIRPRGTVLIICIILLLALGLLALTFVALMRVERSSSRSLARADRLEQVRKMTLAYVRTRLLENIVAEDGEFKTTGLSTFPGSPAWLASSQSEADHWSYVSNLTDDTDNQYQDVPVDDLVDTDGDRIGDARWIPQNDKLPFTNLTAPDGRSHRVAVRIIDTNGLANINVGMAAEFSESQRKLWNSLSPCDLYLRSLLTADEPDDLDSGSSVPGRIPGSPVTVTAALDHLYTYLANPHPPPEAAYVRPFDPAEEIALRLAPIPNLNLHTRFGELLPDTLRDSARLLTAYSWTMQICPTVSEAGIDGAAIDSELESVGFGSPCKVSLHNLANSEQAHRAVYLALQRAGMTPDEAAQFVVNLIDYVDSDQGIRVIGLAGTAANTIDAAALPPALRPGNIYYGTDSQPIIAEVYRYLTFKSIANPDYTGVPGAPFDSDNPEYVSVPDPDNSRYAVELYNPSQTESVNLSGWSLHIKGQGPQTEGYDPAFPGEYDYALRDSIAPGGFLTLVSHYPWTHSQQSITGGFYKIVAGSEALIFWHGDRLELFRPGPDGSGVKVDRSEANLLEQVAQEPQAHDPSTSLPADITDRYHRPGRSVPYGSGPPYWPVITAFKTAGSTTLGTCPQEQTGSATPHGQIILANQELHSLGELFHVPTTANDGNTPRLILDMQSDPPGDSNYRLVPNSELARNIFQHLTLRTGLGDGWDNDGRNEADDLGESRVPGLVNINTAGPEVLGALHAYPQIVGIIMDNRPFHSLAELASRVHDAAKADPGLSYDEDPNGDGVGSPDGITDDNEELIFHFKNIANLITVRSDVFVIYITVQASDPDGQFSDTAPILRTMTILDRSLCLRPAGTPLADLPLPRIIAQMTLP